MSDEPPVYDTIADHIDRLETMAAAHQQLIADLQTRLTKVEVIVVKGPPTS